MVAALFKTLDTHFFAMFSYGTVWTNDFHRLSVNYYVGAILYDTTAILSEYHAYGASVQVHGGVPVMGILIKD